MDLGIDHAIGVEGIATVATNKNDGVESVVEDEVSEGVVEDGVMKLQGNGLGFRLVDVRASEVSCDR